MDFLQERYDLCLGKVRAIAEEGYGDECVGAYFAEVAAFICLMDDYYKFVRQNGLKEAGLEELRSWNHKLYRDILPENYSSSFADPAYAVEELGEAFGQLLSALYVEVRSMIVPVTEQCLEALLIRVELFVEVYSAFEYEWQENQVLPAYESIRQILYWYVSDYSDIAQEEAVKRQVDPEDIYALGVMMEADLSDLRYLYRYGEYVTEEEERTARFMASLPQEKIDLMADTYTEGCRMGLVKEDKALPGKRTVELCYALGSERMMVKTIENFAKLGLKPVLRRSPAGILQGGGLIKLGCLGANPNRQYDYDHKEDKALVWDKAMVQRKLEVLRKAYEKYKEKAYLYAGQAGAETFGENGFEPESKPQALHMSSEQQRLYEEYLSQAEAIQRNYITQL